MEIMVIILILKMLRFCLKLAIDAIIDQRNPVYEYATKATTT